MSTIKLGHKDISFIEVQTEQTVARVEKGLEKGLDKIFQHFDKQKQDNEKINKRIDVLYYVLYTDCLLGFLILATMRNWF